MPYKMYFVCGTSFSFFNELPWSRTIRFRYQRQLAARGVPHECLNTIQEDVEHFEYFVRSAIDLESEAGLPMFDPR